MTSWRKILKKTLIWCSGNFFGLEFFKKSSRKLNFLEENFFGVIFLKISWRFLEDFLKIWVAFLVVIGASFTKPTNIMQDNTGAIAMAKTDAANSRSRHYRIACAYILECYNRRIFNFVWVQTSDMKADILTKPITQPAHGRHEQGMTRYCARRIA